MAKLKFPMKYKGLFIHKYEAKQEKIKGYAIGANSSEVFIDEDEAINHTLSINEYQDILQSCKAKQYKHQFIYGHDDIKYVQDSYFEHLEDCKKAIDILVKKSEI